MGTKLKKYWKKDSGSVKDAGLAFTLLSLIYLFFSEGIRSLWIPILLLLITMTIPKVYRLPAKLWYRLADLLGIIMTNFLLTLLFFLIVFPIGYIRKLIGKDAMQINKWKKNASSVFIINEKLFTKEDLEKPF